MSSLTDSSSTEDAQDGGGNQVANRSELYKPTPGEQKLIDFNKAVTEATDAFRQAFIKHTKVNDLVTDSVGITPEYLESANPTPKPIDTNMGSEKPDVLHDSTNRKVAASGRKVAQPSSKPTPMTIDTVDEILHDFGITYRVLIKEERLEDINTAKSTLYHSLSQRMPAEYDGWTNFGKSDLTEKQEGYNQALEDVKQVLKGYFES